MCQSLITASNNANALKQQKGFSLLIVLAILIVIALIVVGGALYINTDLRIGANDSDRKVAFTYAESTLKGAESELLKMEADLGVPAATVQELITARKFTPECKSTVTGSKWPKGLCTASGTYTPVDQAAVGQIATPVGSETTATPAWERAAVWSTNSIEYTITDSVSSKKPRYIIEILDKDANGTRNYRITSRAWGKNTNTVVTLQSYVSVGE